MNIGSCWVCQERVCLIGVTVRDWSISSLITVCKIWFIIQNGGKAWFKLLFLSCCSPFVAIMFGLGFHAIYSGSYGVVLTQASPLWVLPVPLRFVKKLLAKVSILPFPLYSKTPNLPLHPIWRVGTLQLLWSAWITDIANLFC